LGGLINYKPRWGLIRGVWLVLLLIFSCLINIFLVNIQPFLAYNKPLKRADVLLVEGWLGDQQLQKACQEFLSHNYQIIIATGTPSSLYRGRFLSSYKNLGEVAAATLTSLGCDRNKIIVIPTPPLEINQTVATALAVRQWISGSQLIIKSLNIYGADVHTRRSWLIYQQILAPEYQVGAIAHPPLGYEAKAWWKSSGGVRTVVFETLAYIYSKFCHWEK
ncbi:MAG: YdcF family protein, partial [Cyanobacteria bacterium J083]